MKKEVLLPLAILVIICACEFSPMNNNFVEIDQNITYPTITNKTLDLNEDTLHVWKYTKYEINLESSDQEIIGIEIEYADKKVQFSSNRASFDVNPASIPDGEYLVKVSAYTHSGTNSLADQTGYEAIVFTNEWVLIVEKPQIPDLTISTSIENGFLKYSWNKLDKPYIKSQKLLIRNEGISDSYSLEFENSKTNIFIDSLFVGGKVNLELITYYYDVNDILRMSTTNSSYEYPINLTIQENLDSLTIRWNRNPFRHAVYFSIDYGNYNIINADTSYTIPGQGFLIPRQYHIGFKPIKKTIWDNSMYKCSQKHALGNNYGEAHNNIIYNKELGSYFIKDEMYIRKLSKDLSTTESYDFSWDYINKSAFDYSVDNQYIYSTIGTDLVQLNSNNLNFISSKPILYEEINSINCQIIKDMGDNKFLVGYDSYFIIFDNANGTILSQSSLLKNHYTKRDYNYSISNNCTYAAFCSSKGLIVFEIINKQEFKLLYENDIFYYSVMFDPENENQLILNGKTTIELFDCETCSIEKELTELSVLMANPINFDPLTNNLLLASGAQNRIFIYDYSNNDVLFEMTTNYSPFDLKLLNNKIFSTSGYLFDISNYVN